MVLADFWKEFDTVRDKTMITKLFSLGFSKNCLRWLTSYHSNRFHFVQIDDQMSDKARLHFGVPQGSILGPMLLTFTSLIYKITFQIQSPLFSMQMTLQFI